MNNLNNLFKKNTDNSYKIIAEREPLGAVTEQYRKLRTNIDYSTFNTDLKVLNLTSSFPGEGKTVTVLNLATVYSQSEVKTLVIDMDLRKPKIHRAFNISNNVGLSQLVTKNESLDNVIFKANEFLHVLPAGEKLPFPAEFLMSKKLKALMDTLREQYDKIIIDCPPMTAVADAAIISKIVDGTIVIIASRKTNVDVAQGVIKNLKDNGANVVGGILTRVQKKDHRYAAGYYYYSDER
ncbi:CpsD/CapB family tyrosine-protein kinase [Liberiplasma polymorphum]|uniref:CpsD/CapB family tyrosine-protein kinase n=1 Tax=Liberiplasma polymorphum TaxID=3374570 RepID=UPI003774BC58